MSGTNYRNGVATRRKYSGNVDTTNQYHLVADTKSIRRTAVIHCIGSEADAAERTTDFSFPIGGTTVACLVHDVYLNVKTADATETVDVGTEGTSNDPNGFLSLASLASTGIVQGAVTVTTGANNTYVASSTKGALLATVVAGEDVAAGGDGAYFEHKALITAADPVSYTCSAGTDTAVFDIIIEYSEIVEEIN